MKYQMIDRHGNPIQLSDNRSKKEAERDIEKIAASWGAKVTGMKDDSRGKRK